MNHPRYPRLTSSTMPIMALSIGVSLQPSAIRAELPATAITRSPKPEPTVSTETTYPGSSLPSGEMGLTMSSFLPSRRGSFRVATTVPTTRARIMAALSPAIGLRLRLADRQNVFQALVRARDDMHRNQLSNPARRRRPGIGGRAHGRHVAAHHRGYV